MKLKWVFPPTGGGVSQGFNDSSQEIFRGDSLKNAMREVIQNSLDAVDDKSRPVEVSIQTMDVPASELGAKELSKHVKQAQIWIEKKRNEDGALFYEKALKMLRRKSIPVLAITDSNTKGLNGGRWDTLIHEEGTTNKDVGAAGGSYGIGKNATYTVSAVKAVGYSTRYLERGRTEYFILRCKLSAHQDPKNHEIALQHIGLGTKAKVIKNKPAPPTLGNEIYTGFRLKKQGTGVFIIGFEPLRKGWAKKAEHAIIQSYFTAIHGKKLHMTINGRGINRDTLDSTFRSGGEDWRERHYYHIIRNPDIKRHYVKTVLGSFVVQVRAVEEDNVHHVAYVNRRGMLITDARQSGSNPFYSKIGIWARYAAVVSAADDATDEKIRKMEPPSHDAIRIGLIHADEREHTSKMLKEVRDQIAKIIYDEIKDTAEQQSINVAELAGILPHKPDKNGAGQRGRIGELKAIQKPVRDIGGGYTGSEKKGGKKGSDRKPKKGRAGGIGGNKERTFSKPRIMRNGEKLRVAFTPTTSKNMRFTIKPAGEERKHQQSIDVAGVKVICPPGKTAKVDGALVSVDLGEGERFVADLAVKHSDAYTGYEIVGYPVEESK